MQVSLFKNKEKPGTNKISPKIEESWKAMLTDEFNQSYFQNIKEHLQEERSKGTTIYPPGKLIFNAFNLTPFDKVKVIIIGQDPYHGKGQAHGLCFSVQENIQSPPSLVNIFKELHDDLNIPIPKNGNLEKWAAQGVLLLNAMLTVKANQPASHRDIGWEDFTNAVIKQLSEKKKGLVFLLWGKFAQDKGMLIDTSKHHILAASHPSPYSANNGFFGCKHFSKTNTILKQEGIEEIDWIL